MPMVYFFFADGSTRALEKVTGIAKKQADRNMLVRFIFNMTDAGQILRTREMIKTATRNFQVSLSIFEFLFRFAS
jgi:hypothetical protein